MTPRLFGLALLVHLAVWCGCIAQQLGGQPAPPPHLGPDVQDVVFLGPNRPVLVRLHLEMDGKPFRGAFREAWDSHVKKLFAFLDRDTDGRLSPREAERMPPPQMFLTVGIPGLGNSAINVAFNFGVVDADSDGGVNLAELSDYYREYRTAPFVAQNAVRAAAAPVNAALFTRLDTNRDGSLNDQEIAAAMATLKWLDLDEDDLITAQELSTANPNRNPGLPPPAVPARGPSSDDFIPLDPDDEKKVVLPLMARYGQPLVGGGGRTVKADKINLDPAELAQLDTDKDNQLSASELAHFAEIPPHLELTARFVRGKTGAASWELHDPNPLKAAKTAAGSFLVTADSVRLELIQNDRVPERLPAGADAYLNHLQDVDANNDGRLSKNEAQPSPFFGKLFVLLDRNDDGTITPKETADYLFHLQEGQFLAMAGRVHLLISQPGVGLFDLLDRNQDGRLSPREVRDLPTLLAALDADGDGTLVPNETPRTYRLALGMCQASFNRFGGNLVSLPPQLPNTATVDLLRGGPVWFRKMDRNRDGDVSPREFLGSPRTFDKLDSNHDGLISAEEANLSSK